MRSGFSLVELLVALVIFQIGLLGAAGMVLLAQRHVLRAELVLRATVEADALADSLLRHGGGGGGFVETAWGQLRWEAASPGEGSLQITALDAVGADTLSTVVAWPQTRIPGGSDAP